jgi:hypothetical protein
MKEHLNKAIGILDSYISTESEGYIILYKGKQIKLPSGKSIWSKKNHASAALTNSLYGHFSKYRHGITPSEVTKLLIKEGLIEVKKL